MSRAIPRRSLLQSAGAAFLVPIAEAQSEPLKVAGQEVELAIYRVSPLTARVTVCPLANGQPAAIADDGCLIASAAGTPVAKMRSLKPQTVKAGDLSITISAPLTLTVKNAKGVEVQTLAIDPETAALSFHTGSAPILGLGEGGPQFDRRGKTDRMRSGQGGGQPPYSLRNWGGRVPVPWLIGTEGWALFIHQPTGTFDFTGPESKFQPLYPSTSAPTPAPPNAAGQPQQPTPPAHQALPLEFFVVASKDPMAIMGEYARLTGLPELPARWTFGYQQSHRTLASREEILGEAKAFRDAKLPLDAMIYLSTGFCPSGWNNNNGDFTFNSRVFPDPKPIFDEFHKQDIKVVLHVAYPTQIYEMKGTVNEPCTHPKRPETESSCYWDMHKPVWTLGVDGWWPDEGDSLNLPSRLVRNRFYWDACRLDRPNERPYALHRNGAAGMQRYAAFLWSGDVNSQWETLKNHLPNAVNVGLSGIPYWGTDIGGFVPTPEYDGELYVRWFQFGAFNTLFRSHGRIWPLHSPLGWNSGQPSDLVMRETPTYHPDPSVFHNAQVEPICRKYLNVRYQLMPYLYSAVQESTRTGLPVLRSLWLHYPEDATAVARGDQYLWGRDILVAPIVEKGATERKLYLPKGDWYDFWTGQVHQGGMEITRTVSLDVMPLYVRAGAIVPMDPVRQYTWEKVNDPTTLTVYPHADGSFLMYEDDGSSFDYKKGEWMGLQLAWSDAKRTLSMRLARGSKMLGAKRVFHVKAGDAAKDVTFDGKPIEVKL